MGLVEDWYPTASALQGLDGCQSIHGREARGPVLDGATGYSLLTFPPLHVRSCLCFPNGLTYAWAGAWWSTIPSRRRSGPKYQPRQGKSRLFRRPAHRVGFTHVAQGNRRVRVFGERKFQTFLRDNSAAGRSHPGDRYSSTEPNYNYDL